MNDTIELRTAGVIDPSATKEAFADLRQHLTEALRNLEEGRGSAEHGIARRLADGWIHGLTTGLEMSPADVLLGSLLRHRPPAVHPDLKAALLLHLEQPGAPPIDVPLPGTATRELLNAIAALLVGHIVAWSSPGAGDEEIGTGELAELMRVSPPTAVAVLDRGEIPSRVTPGGHRRVLRRDALQWLAQHERQRQTLRELSSRSQRLERGTPSLPRDIDGDPDREDDHE